IINYVRRNYGSLIGEATAERIKHEIGSAYPGDEVREIEVRGRMRKRFIPERPVPVMVTRLFELPVQISLPVYSLERPANPQPLA
ncbi:rod shape-determining protein, partial [Salmonella enterica subsp. enterica serovar Kentucky]|nr:rod shape-determining protein [Salmonella enterica subsp. enterica serovar Kentucky]